MSNAFDTTPRQRLTDQQRARLFLDASGQCAVCTRSIRPGEVWHDDHETALMNGGGNEIENRRVICRNCHVPKTTADHAVATKARDVATKHVVPHAMRKKRGPVMPGNKASAWKKKINGEAVRR
jgi:5-methylcytosine-specific restriction endonuclease McrA